MTCAALRKLYSRGNADVLKDDLEIKSSSQVRRS